MGIGVHSGVAFIGIMGTLGGVTDMTAVGEEVDLPARLGSHAGLGEILVSEAAMQAANLPSPSTELRELTLKGLTEPVLAHVMRLD